MVGEVPVQPESSSLDNVLANRILEEASNHGRGYEPAARAHKGETVSKEQESATPKRTKCAKCRDVKKWSPAEDVNGDGILWHWFLSGSYHTALAKKCMRR
jgi:hypothetical protein